MPPFLPIPEYRPPAGGSSNELACATRGTDGATPGARGGSAAPLAPSKPLPCDWTGDGDGERERDGWGGSPKTDGSMVGDLGEDNGDGNGEDAVMPKSQERRDKT